MQNDHPGFQTTAEALQFILSGKATFTVSSAKTGKHFTYKVVKSPKGGIPGKEPRWFVSVLNGPDNWENYEYIGFMTGDTGKLIAGRKGRPEAPSFKALSWTLQQLVHRDEMHPNLTVQHEGKCGACGRKLTRPQSIASGIGPECAKKG